MSTLQIRNVPEETSRTLKARAASAGQSLSEYLLAEVTRIADRPTLEEISARVDLHWPSGDVTPAARILAAERLEH